jgi:hypothetical protein
VDSVAGLLRKATVYIFPRVNPDAAEAFFVAPRYERRLNARSMDLDRDGAKDEDGYEDLNGDGLITMMRVTDPAGAWVPDEEVPELLREAESGKGETGLYRLLSEGRDNDGDGKWNEDEPGGVDFNRNFSYTYRFFAPGSGMHQISEAESRALADFVFAHPNIAAVFSFSPNDNLLHPPKAEKEKKEPGGRKPVAAVLPDDATYANEVSEKFKALTGLADAPKPTAGEGAFAEWAYYHFGRWSFSVPAWWPPVIKEKPDTSAVEEEGEPKNQKEEKKKGDGKGKGKPDPLANQRRLWKWLQATDQKEGFVAWTEISHPDFPAQKVEVGGFRPYVGINPPADSLKNRAEGYGGFLHHLAASLPGVKIERVEVEHLHDRVYRLRAYVTNDGYLATNTQLGVRSQWNPKVKVELKLTEKQRLVSGRVITLIGSLAGSGGSKELSWLVVGEKGSEITISAGSPMAGKEEKTIRLR